MRTTPRGTSTAYRESPFPHASKTLTHSAVNTWLSSAASSFSVTRR